MFNFLYTPEFNKLRENYNIAKDAHNKAKRALKIAYKNKYNSWCAFVDYDVDNGDTVRNFENEVNMGRIKQDKLELIKKEFEYFKETAKKDDEYYNSAVNSYNHRKFLIERAEQELKDCRHKYYEVIRTSGLKVFNVFARC